MGKLGRAWVGAWVSAWVGAWVDDVVMVCDGGGKMHVCTTWIDGVGLGSCCEVWMVMVRT